MWRESPLVAWLQDHPLPTPVYANEPGAVYWFAHQSAMASPAFYPFHSPTGPADDPSRLTAATSGSIVLFSFADGRDAGAGPKV